MLDEVTSTSDAAHLGMLSSWEATRDRNACTTVPQTAHQFSRTFARRTG